MASSRHHQASFTRKVSLKQGRKHFTFAHQHKWNRAYQILLPQMPDPFLLLLKLTHLLRIGFLNRASGRVSWRHLVNVQKRSPASLISSAVIISLFHMYFQYMFTMAKKNSNMRAKCWHTLFSLEWSLIDPHPYQKSRNQRIVWVGTELFWGTTNRELKLRATISILR